jgi:mRNA interferase RelE/StbE
MKIEFSKDAGRFLRKQDKKNYQRIIKKIKSLTSNPFPQDCQRIQGRKEKVFRIRIGNMRIMYVVLKERNLIFITEIGKRGNIYK